MHVWPLPLCQNPILPDIPEKWNASSGKWIYHCLPFALAVASQPRAVKHILMLHGDPKVNSNKWSHRVVFPPFPRFGRSSWIQPVAKMVSDSVSRMVKIQMPSALTSRNDSNAWTLARYVGRRRDRLIGVRFYIVRKCLQSLEPFFFIRHPSPMTAVREPGHIVDRPIDRSGVL